jgi:hypothetical protein
MEEDDEELESLSAQDSNKRILATEGYELKHTAKYRRLNSAEEERELTVIRSSNRVNNARTPRSVASISAPMSRVQRAFFNAARPKHLGPVATSTWIPQSSRRAHLFIASITPRLQPTTRRQFR